MWGEGAWLYVDAAMFISQKFWTQSLPNLPVENQKHTELQVGGNKSIYLILNLIKTILSKLDTSWISKIAWSSLIKRPSVAGIFVNKCRHIGTIRHLAQLMIIDIGDTKPYRCALLHTSDQ